MNLSYAVPRTFVFVFLLIPRGTEDTSRERLFEIN